MRCECDTRFKRVQSERKVSGSSGAGKADDARVTESPLAWKRDVSGCMCVRSRRIRVRGGTDASALLTERLARKASQGRPENEDKHRPRGVAEWRGIFFSFSILEIKLSKIFFEL